MLLPKCPARRRFAIVRQLPRPKRPLGNILQDILKRDPEWFLAYAEIAEAKAEALDAADLARQQQKA